MAMGTVWASGAWGASAWADGSWADVEAEAAYAGAYAAEHASALRDVCAAGYAVTFSTGTPGTYDAATGTFTTPTTGTVLGFAMRKIPTQADLDRFRQRGLTEDKTALLLVVASTYGEHPAMGATVTWEGETMTVRDRRPLSPDGVVIKSDIAVCR